MADTSGSAAGQIVGNLVSAARRLPGVAPEQVVLFGHSRGAGASVNFVLAGGTVRALVLDSGVYPDNFSDQAEQIRVPTLMLHGTADSPTDGGAASTNVEMARKFEEAMRRAGRAVEAVYYEGGGHNSIFTNAIQFDNEVQHIIAFIQRHSRN
jgi:pimeloyl-ACP methyl ester carboxylesterase